ncbi:MAG: hypothetical protein RLP44_30410 [Aggregatilineales bacterium]
MERLNTVWRVFNAASTVRDLALHSRTYYFAAGKPMTFYLNADNATVQVKRWSRPMIEVKATLQAAFGWRVATDYDDVGVYIAAKRLPLISGLSTARFEVLVPRETYLVIRVDDGALLLDNMEGTLHIPPPTDADTNPLMLRYENPS